MHLPLENRSFYYRGDQVDSSASTNVIKMDCYIRTLETDNGIHTHIIYILPSFTSIRVTPSGDRATQVILVLLSMGRVSDWLLQIKE